VHNLEEMKTVTFTIKNTTISEVKKVILEKDLNHGLKTSLHNHLENAEKYVKLAKEYPNSKQQYTEQAISTLEDLKKKVSHLPKKQVSDQDKQEVTHLVDEVIASMKDEK
jgi:hypothetical protein